MIIIYSQKTMHDTRKNQILLNLFEHVSKQTKKINYSPSIFVHRASIVYNLNQL